jgi:hypothetical protein
MTTVIINEKTEKGKKLLDFLKSFSGERFIKIEKEPNETTKKAIQDAREGKLTKAKNVNDLMEQLKA